MKVLVTGASGFIGSALCDSLLVRGDTVVGLARDPKRARQTNPRVEWHAWQPTLERPPAKAFEGVDGVVNLLGEKINQRWTDEAKQRIMESRRTGTHNLVGTIAGLERKPRVLVSQSAIGFYGNRGEAIVDESSDSGEGFDAEVVREWEKAAHEADGTGVRLVVVRTGHVLDPRGGFLGQLLPPFKLGVGGPLAGGAQYVSWVHVDDEVGHPAVGARQREGRRHDQLHGAQPGDQQGFLEGAGQGTRTARRGAGARDHAGPDVRQRVRGGPPRWPACIAEASAGPWIRVPTSRAGRGAGGFALAG